MKPKTTSTRPARPDSPLRARSAPLLLIALAWGGAGTGGAAAQEPPLLAPGASAVDVSRARLGTDTTRVFMRRSGQTRLSVLQIEERARGTRDDGAVLRQVLRIERPDGALVLADTTWHGLPGLRPLEHRSHGSGRTLTLDYGPSEVTGTRAPDSGTAGAIRVELPRPVFDPSASTLILESLELEPGDRLRIPFLDHRQEEVVHHRVHAVELTEVEDDDGRGIRALKVETHLPDGRQLVYWLDTTNRRLVKGMAPAGPGATMILRP